MRIVRRTAAAAALVLSAALVTACGSDSGPGPAAAPPDPVVDLTKLDIGNLPTQPKHYGKADNPDLARAVQAERMANYIPLPSEVNPEVKYPAAAINGAIRPFIDFGSGAMKLRVNAKPDVLAAAAPGFVSGFVTTGNSEKAPGLGYEYSNVVLQFTDDAAATTAAQALGQADFDAVPGSQRLRIDKYPDAFVYLDTQYDFNALVRSWYATGRFVLFTYIWDDMMAQSGMSDPAKLLARAQLGLDAIPPALAKIPVFPQDQLTEQPVDLDGVLGRTLPTVNDDRNERGIPGVYDRHGGLQLFPEDDAAALFDKAGVDRVAFNGATVYRARDAAGADAIVAARSETSRVFRPADSPANLPNAQCRKYIGPVPNSMTYYCYVRRGRFAAEVATGQLLDAQQRISAQYAMLVNAEH
ncbi:hypothetical protein GPX89_16790 [Nocardia sp. ET3-3]|uniref:Uncharacterized protein n=1 Tax=Nocardia terrae TaxID=2675851 RepID=A0A7K1UWY2_9NOCA|nr:hypothetical protein [Nocardia terrae]MVU78896.1 hypothetical protein [Nocardia terrae]